MSSKKLSLSKRAEEFARKKHHGLKRKDGITPSIRHLKQVVERLEKMGITKQQRQRGRRRDEHILCAGWLHDVIEDTDVTYDTIQKKFGRDVAEMVVAVSKDNRLSKKKRDEQYIAQLKRCSFGAKAVKLADIVANLADLEKSNYSRKKKVDAVKQKVRYLRAIKPGIASKRSHLAGLEEIENELNDLLEFYKQKRFYFFSSFS